MRDILLAVSAVVFLSGCATSYNRPRVITYDPPVAPPLFVIKIKEPTEFVLRRGRCGHTYLDPIYRIHQQ